ncbi:MAG: hypothetical protein R3E01_07565 [Pirellulaceae bacterium]|nr:hypothetical protein [Planctomycetales bacterium]
MSRLGHNNWHHDVQAIGEVTNIEAAYCDSECGLEVDGISVSFAFEGALSELLRDYLRDDTHASHLSWKYRLYYRLRPFIPISVRQRLQRRRNQTLSVSDQWYIPKRFLNQFRVVLEAELPERGDVAMIHPWPKSYGAAVSLTHDVETLAGVKRVPELAAMEERLGLRSAWNFIPYKYRIDRGLLAELQQRGHEICVHGYNHDGLLFTSPKLFARRAVGINRAAREFGAVGFRAPMVHRNLEWLQQLDFQYDSSYFDIDPFQAMPGGVGGVWPLVAGRFVELPYTLPQDHTLLVVLGEQSPQIWMEKLRLLKQLAGMALLITHPDYLDSHGSLAIYQRFLEHVHTQTDLWKALPKDIARWWVARQASTVDSQSDGGAVAGPAAELGQVTTLNDLFSEWLSIR